MLVKKHGIQDVDILQIDTEGYDYEIVNTIPFNIIKPKIVRYEWKHLNDENRKESIMLLKRRKYKVLQFGIDNVALLSLQGIRLSVIGMWILDFIVKTIYVLHL
jgi:hypothetical protein